MSKSIYVKVEKDGNANFGVKIQDNGSPELDRKVSGWEKAGDNFLGVDNVLFLNWI